MALQPGLTILNKYRIVKLVGEGGMARVWLAEEVTFDGRRVAIKEPKAGIEAEDAADVQRRFQQEISLTAALMQARAPNIVPAWTVEPLDGGRVLVMHYMPGGSLEELLRQPEHAAGLPVERAVAIALDVLGALEALHRLPMEPVHRDVKPSNILFDGEGRACLADFGLAQLPGVSGRSRLAANAHPATSMYAAPEQLRSPEPLLPAADQFALGCVLWEMLTGQRYKRHKPGTPPSRLRGDVPAWLDRVVMQALAEDAWERWPNAGEMAGALRASATPSRSAKPEQAQRTQPQASKQPPAQMAGAPPIAAAHTGSDDGAGRRRPAWQGWLAGAVAVMALLMFWSLSGGIREGGDATATSTTAVPAVAHITDTSTMAPSRETPTAPTDTPAPPIDTSIPSTDTLSPLTDTLTLPTNTLVPPKIGGGGGNQAPVFWRPSLVTAPPVSPTDTPVPPTNTPIPPTPTNTSAPLTDTPAPPTATSTPTLGIGSTMITEVDGMEYVYVPAGEFLMGSSDNDYRASADERPQHTVYLDGYWIARTEVTNAMFARFVDQTGYQTDAEKAGSAANWRFPLGSSSSLAGLDTYPVVLVSWNDAAAYCRWAGCRLPTEAEWEKAARGTDGRLWPWGNQKPDATLSNFSLNLWHITPVGSQLVNASLYGALDMAGNVREWVADWYNERAYTQSSRDNPTGPENGSLRVLRGGSWVVNAPDASDVRVAMREGHTPDYSFYRLGFRPALSP